MRIHVIGTGLIGASIALAAQSAGHSVTGEDTNADHVEHCTRLGLSVFDSSAARTDSELHPDLVFVAVPPRSAANVMVSAHERFTNATISDVTSVKSTVLEQVASRLGNSPRVIGAHPMAGREVSGPGAARADLFEDRIWVITPTHKSDPRRVEQLSEFIENLGSSSVTMTGTDHDRVVALVSHTPQILASVMAAQLNDASESDLAISGTGLADVIRIAGSDPQLWCDILQGNSEYVGAVLDGVIAQLTSVKQSLAEHDDQGLKSVLEQGNRGKNKVPGKHGEKARIFESVNVMISDQPGALAALFNAAGTLGVNLEDVRIEHVMGRRSGIVQLVVSATQSEKLEQGLATLNFDTRGRS